MRDRYPDAARRAATPSRVGNFFAPATLDEAIAFKRDHPGCTIVQGGTDVGVWVNKRNFAAPADAVAGEDRFAATSCARKTAPIVAGANTSRSPISKRSSPIASPSSPASWPSSARRRSRTPGRSIGNIANGSPIGDTLPYLFVAGAVLELNGGARTVPIDRFYLGYSKFDLQPDEIITRVRIGIVRDTLKLYKVSPPQRPRHLRLHRRHPPGA